MQEMDTQRGTEQLNKKVKKKGGQGLRLLQSYSSCVRIRERKEERDQDEDEDGRSEALS